MIRHDEPGISVTLSAEGLRRAYSHEDMLSSLRGVRLIERIHAAVAWGAAFGLAILIAYSAVSGN